MGGLYRFGIAWAGVEAGVEWRTSLRGVGGTGGAGGCGRVGRVGLRGAGMCAAGCVWGRTAVRRRPAGRAAGPGAGGGGTGRAGRSRRASRRAWAGPPRGRGQVSRGSAAVPFRRASPGSPPGPRRALRRGSRGACRCFYVGLRAFADLLRIFTGLCSGVGSRPAPHGSPGGCPQASRRFPGRRCCGGARRLGGCSEDAQEGWLGRGLGGVARQGWLRGWLRGWPRGVRRAPGGVRASG